MQKDKQAFKFVNATNDIDSTHAITKNIKNKL